MKIGAIAPYFGGKRTMAPQIVDMIGPHRAYWEPFCGSMAVLLAKPRCQMETANDLNGDLINLARTIQDQKAGASLYRQLRRTWVSQEIHQQSAEIITTKPFEPTPERAYWYFIYGWLGRNGSLGTTSGNNFCVRYTANGGSPGKRFESAVESIPQWRERMRGVIILNLDAFEMLARIDDADGNAIYADPPYFTKGAKYEYDFDSVDHERLADLLQRFKKTRVVLSYYDHPAIDRLYPAWQKIDCSKTKSLVSAGKRDKGNTTVAPEVLLVNDSEPVSMFE